MALKYPDRLESQNPQAYGIVKASEVVGHKHVLNIVDLFSIPDGILSESGNNTDNDAIGQRWFITNKGSFYELRNWNERHSAEGWFEIAGTQIGVQQIVAVVSSLPLTGYLVGDIVYLNRAYLHYSAGFYSAVQLSSGTAGIGWQPVSDMNPSEHTIYIATRDSDKMYYYDGSQMIQIVTGGTSFDPSTILPDPTMTVVTSISQGENTIDSYEITYEKREIGDPSNIEYDGFYIPTASNSNAGLMTGDDFASLKHTNYFLGIDKTSNQVEEDASIISFNSSASGMSLKYTTVDTARQDNDTIGFGEVKLPLVSSSQSGVISAIQWNELNDTINDKQDQLVSGSSLKTINNESLLGSGNIEISSEIPIASETILGGIKVGAGLTINPDTGVLSATGGGTADSVDWANITSKPDVFEPVPHEHEISDVTGLQEELDDKQPAGNYALKSEIPVNTSQLNNNSGFITQADVDEQIENKLDASIYNQDKSTFATKDEIPVINVATKDTLGIVRPGTGLSISNGVLNVTGEAAVDPSSLPVASETTLGAVMIGDGLQIDSSGTITLDLTIQATLQTKTI